MEKQQGIHPGVVNGKRIFPKSDTCGSKSRRRVERAIAGVEKHCEAQPNNQVAKTQLANLRTRLAGLPAERKAKEAA